MKYSKWVGGKISKIMHEGIKGHKVSQKQAIAVAISMAREKGKKAPGRYSRNVVRMAKQL